MTDFWKNRSASDGLQWYCKPCVATKTKEYDARHPEQTRARYRRQHLAQVAKGYGVTLDELDRRLLAQGSKCAICGDLESVYRNGRVRRLSLDHDHETGQPRGFLCAQCNSGLGQFRDDPRLIRRAARYLSTYAGLKD